MATVWLDMLGIAIVLIIFWSLIEACYNLLFHPLRHIPGSKLAASSHFYEFFYEVFHAGGGQYYRQVQAMHLEYGKRAESTLSEIHARAIN